MTEICQGVPTTWNLYTQTFLFPEITDWHSQFVSTKLIAFYRFGRYFITTLRHKVPTQNWVNWLSVSHKIYTLKPCHFPKSLIGAHSSISSPHFATRCHPSSRVNWPECESAGHYSARHSTVCGKWHLTLPLRIKVTVPRTNRALHIRTDIPRQSLQSNSLLRRKHAIVSHNISLTISPLYLSHASHHC